MTLPMSSMSSPVGRGDKHHFGLALESASSLARNQCGPLPFPALTRGDCPPGLPLMLMMKTMTARSLTMCALCLQMIGDTTSKKERLPWALSLELLGGRIF